MLVRAKFPQIYELNHPKTGSYWLVSARSKQWNLNERRTFSIKKHAEEYADEVRARIQQFGAQPDLTPLEKVKAGTYDQLAGKLDGFGMTPEQAIEQFVKIKAEEITTQAKPFIRDLAEQWKEFKYTNKGLSERFQNEIRTYTRFIKNQWGEKRPDEIKKNEIEQMLNGLKLSNNTRRKYLLFIRMFFGWVLDEGHIIKKPTDGIRFIADPFHGEFYSPDETKQLLKYINVNHPELVGYYALLTFAGLRPTEGKRVRWEDFNFKTNQLLVRKGKTHPRHVNLQPVALAWIQHHRQNTAAGKPFVDLQPADFRERTIHQSALDGKWVQDGLRHGFGTLFNALTQNIEKVAHEMGNSITIAKKHYARTIPQDECDAFWKLSPAVVMADETEGKHAHQLIQVPFNKE